MSPLLLATLLVLIIGSFYYWRKNKTTGWFRSFLISVAIGILAIWLYLSFNVFRFTGEAGLLNRYFVIVLAIVLLIFVWRVKPGDKDRR
jgi:hypothetical protein